MELDPADRVEEEINRALREGRPINMAAAFPVPAGVSQHDEIPEMGSPPPLPGRDATPGERIQHVARHAPEYLTEYRLTVLHRLMLRQLPLEMIAHTLGCSVRFVFRLRKELCARLVSDASGLDPYEIGGRAVAFYEENRAAFLRIADDGNQPIRTRMRALAQARGANNDLQRFLHVSGFWQANPMDPKKAKKEAETAAKAEDLIQQMMRLVAGGSMGAVDEFYGNQPLDPVDTDDDADRDDDFDPDLDTDVDDLDREDL
ncbi:hypothetical protein [Zavarzinia sp. CC-PAN008]|uniref:hypothetical protein n=1 Tax=Zavarzinia sp. CC-PAN008 TaxID=3243332 RepID=UPI003F7464EB